MTVHLDVSQLVQDPRRSGIQRAERELIRYWPGPAPLRPCRFERDTGELHALPDHVFELLCDDAPAGGLEVERLRLASYLVRGPVVRPERLLSAELFLDPGRAAYYRENAPGRPVFWLVYDFIPWLQPEWFGVGSAARLMPFLHTLRAIPNLAFISSRTRDDCCRRVLRREVEGPVIPMGGDALRLERQIFDPLRRRFVMLGTIEQRKNAATVMRAFQALWRDLVDVELVLIGGVSPDALEEQNLLAELALVPQFRHLWGLPDHGVREEMRGARALLFPSVGEGYGIPPMEALHAGVPAVVSADLPALDGLAGLGQIRLRDVSPESIAAAAGVLMDEREGLRLWDEAARLRVPSWADFAQRVATWVQD